MIINDSIINAVSNVLKSIRSLRYKTLLLFFLVFVVYLFQDELKYLFKTKVIDSDRIVLELDSHALIDNALKSLMVEAKADRAYIFRFHNGDAYYNGTHKNKMSCDYEVVTNGTSREAVRLQNMPVSLFSQFIKDVLILKMFYPDISNMQDVVTKSELERQGIKGITAVPYYRDGKLFAIVGLDYVRNLGDVNGFAKNSQKEKEWLLSKAEQIGDLLI